MPTSSSSPGADPRPRVDWWRAPADAAARGFAVVPARGLDEREAAQRLEAHGPNLIEAGKRRGPLSILLAQLFDVLILVLVAAAIVSALLGETLDALAIVAIVVLNAIIGFVQEYRAERAMEALSAMAAPSARIRREGRVRVVPAAEVAPGDVVLLEAGQVVPADLRLTDAAGLETKEAALTGESGSVSKTVREVDDADAGVGDRVSMAYKGTIVARGRGEGIAVATGMQTELGRIATLLTREPATRTPLERRLAAFGRRLAAAVLLICAVLFVVGLLRGEPALLMFLTAVSLAVAAIPEALPAVVTVALALGARRMAARNALVRKLAAVESLGSVTWICADKTGTLTRNEMEVDAVEPTDESRRDALVQAMALCNDAERGEGGELTGDPTETALARAAAEVGLFRKDLEQRLPRLAEIPFDSERKRMTTFHADGDAVIAYTKGAPEAVLDLCAEGAGGAAGAKVREAADAMADRGLRVLALARRWWPSVPSALDPETVEQDLVLLGLVGLIDPPRAEARHAVAECQGAGIVPVMITGDHPATARTIAKELGLLDGDADGKVLTGADLRRSSPDELRHEVTRVRVFARVDPEQKIDIVRALQDNGQLVAMTGDGVNDAPALRRADVGVAMGKGGTDVAREAAALILLDDDFATIVAAVEEGRRIFDNIRKFVRFVLGGNLGEILTVFLAPILGLPMALLPIQILWVNLLTDGLPGLALTVEAAEPGSMARKPMPPEKSVFDLAMGRHVAGVGTLIGALTLATFWVTHRLGLPEAQTMTFTVLTLAQMGHVMAVRAERASTFTVGLLANRAMIGAVVLTVLLQVMVIYVPFFQNVMRTQALTALELAICGGLAVFVFAAVEIGKAVGRAWRRRS